MDAERPHKIRIVKEIAVGAELGGMNAGGCAQVVEFVGVPGNPDGAQHFARFVAD
jgi:hypothetical protein